MVVAEQELAALKSQLARLGGTDANSGSDFIVPKGNIPQAGMEYIRKLRDVKYYETVDELIAKQFEIAKLDEARQGSIIQVADVAVAPDKKSSPHRTTIVLLMTMVAFVISTLWVLAVSRWQWILLDPDKHRKVQTLRGILFKKRA
jgi:tyrosine-protein kinase Etk/Wzc